MEIPDLSDRQVLADLLEGRAADDAVAVEAYSLFGLGVPPFEGVFLDPDVTARRPLAEALRADELPESLGRWVPAFCAALRDLESPLGDAVADRLDELVPAAEQTVGDPDAPVLDDAETDLRALVDHLVTPLRCGVFFSRPLLERVARDAGVPRGFGPRARILRQLLMGASRYEELPRVLLILEAVARRHAAALGGAWQARAEATSELLAGMVLRLRDATPA